MKEMTKYYLKTYGCRMNYADSDRIRFMLDNQGLKEVEKPEEAEVIILNSCSVRQQAEDKIVGWVEKVETEEYKNKQFILTGCMAVRYDRKSGKRDVKYEEKLKKLLPWVDKFIDSNDLEGLSLALDKQSADQELESFEHENNLRNYTFQSDKFIGNIPISMGCDFFCSYCIVPFTRGDMVHRDYNVILDEVRNFLSKGGKLVTLIGQNVNSWKGLRGSDVIGFPELLEDICKLEGEFWVNFVSSNPMDFTQELADVVVQNDKIIKCLNLAVQSGSDDVLRKMNRHYTVEHFMNIVKMLKTPCPNFNLSTDIIVGFPGETDEDFEKSLELVRKAEFSMIYIGKYSPRKGTIASKFENDVPLKVKKSREIALKAELDRIRRNQHDKWVGKELEVLILGSRRGISFYFHEIQFINKVDESYIGKFKKCIVKNSSTSGLVCELI